MKDLTCNICEDRSECKKLCQSMQNKLHNSIRSNKLHADTSFKDYNICMSNIDEINVYTYGLSEVESRDTKRIVVAILTKDQRELLKLYSEGYTQKEIADKLKVTQSNISQKLEAIKRELKKSLIEILPSIV